MSVKTMLLSRPVISAMSNLFWDGSASAHPSTCMVRTRSSSSWRTSTIRPPVRCLRTSIAKGVGSGSDIGGSEVRQTRAANGDADASRDRVRPRPTEITMESRDAEYTRSILVPTSSHRISAAAADSRKPSICSHRLFIHEPPNSLSVLPASAQHCICIHATWYHILRRAAQRTVHPLARDCP